MQSSAEITLIPPQLVTAMWPKVFPFIMQGLSAATDVTLQNIFDDLGNGEAGLWCIVSNGEICAAFLTSVFRDQDTNKPFLGVYALGGQHLCKWAHLLGDRMLEFARAWNCVSVRFHGRKGWKRALPTYRPIAERQHGVFVYERAA